MFLHGLNDYSLAKVNRVPKFPERLEEPPPRKGFLSDDQYDLLQANCPHAWLKALLCLSYTYGFRQSELVGRPQENQAPLRVGQLDMHNRTIRLWPGETKSGEERTIKMTEEAYNPLRPCIEGKNPQDPVFIWKDGRVVKDFRGAWSKMLEDAGVSILLHDFRRRAARNLIRNWRFPGSGKVNHRP